VWARRLQPIRHLRRRGYSRPATPFPSGMRVRPPLSAKPMTTQTLAASSGCQPCFVEKEKDEEAVDEQAQGQPGDGVPGADHHADGPQPARCRLAVVHAGDRPFARAGLAPRRPRNPIPVTICAETAGPSHSCSRQKAKENHGEGPAEPRQTSVMVRNPAGFFSRRFGRSRPRIIPQITAAMVNRTGPHGVGRSVRQLSDNQDMCLEAVRKNRLGSRRMNDSRENVR